MAASDWSILVGFIAGFAGSVHCVAMCGGLVGVISASMKAAKLKAAVYWTIYHCGRILSYTLAGALVGALAGQASELFPMHRAHVAGTLISGIIMVILGGHIAHWWNVLGALEKLGGRVWHRFVAVFSKLLPPRLPWQAFFGGMLWGWIPCGLVYSTLVLATTTASPASGGLVMLAFGIGTLPMVISMGVVADRIGRLARFRWVFGSFVATVGILITIGVIPLHPESHDHSRHHAHTAM